MKTPEVLCPSCGLEAEFVKGDAIYPHRPDLRHLRFWLCRPCWTYVSCIAGTNRPRGPLANAALRLARREAHMVFDRLWQSGTYTRSEAYNWLAAKLKLKPGAAHIGSFGLDMCRKTVEVCGTARLEYKARPSLELPF